MRIAAISDIHGNLPALRAVLDDIAQQACDVVVNLGDIVSGPLLPAETAALLIELDLPTIRGNHERQLLETPRAKMGASDGFAHDALRPSQFDWLRKLPASMELGSDVLLCHGTPESDLVLLLETLDGGNPRAATVEEVQSRLEGVTHGLILCGHTHIQRTVCLDDGRLVLNPGSVGLPAYEDLNPYPHRVETGTPQARYAIADNASGAWQAQLRSVDYGYSAMSELAARNGRPEWAYALRTGYMPSH